MTVIAGIYAVRGGVGRNLALWMSIKAKISRYEHDNIIEYMNDKCCMAKIDVGALSSTANVLDKYGNFAMLAGDPLLHDCCIGQVDRLTALNKLQIAISESDDTVLQNTSGMFCGSFFYEKTKSLVLVSDKFGLRSLYYMRQGDVVIFASSLRIFEDVSEIKLTMSLRASCEKIVFGSPLAERTPFVDVSCLNDAEIVFFEDDKIEKRRYWAWEHTPINNQTIDQCAVDLYDLFINAIDCRLEGDRSVRAFLSGGLDSRCIVAALQEHGVGVLTYNFERKNTYDQLISSKFAEYIGSEHHSVTIPEDEEHQVHAKRLNVFFPFTELANKGEVTRPQVLWTGDGGSVGAGYVYLTEKMVFLLRKGLERQAIEEFLTVNGWGFSGKFLANSLYKGNIHDLIVSWVHEELDKIHCPDPGRKLFIFLMRNDQRRHYFEYLEDIDLLRIEYISPFFDPNFLAYFSSIPIDVCLYHKMYMRWMLCFSTDLTAIPWQAYAGHVPCPMKMPEEGRLQWDKGEFAKGRRAYILRDLKRLLSSEQLPGNFFSGMRICAAKHATQLGIRDYSYLLQEALLFGKYYTVCGGKYSIDW